MRAQGFRRQTQYDQVFYFTFDLHHFHQIRQKASASRSHSQLMWKDKIRHIVRCSRHGLDNKHDSTFDTAEMSATNAEHSIHSVHGATQATDPNQPLDTAQSSWASGPAFPECGVSSFQPKPVTPSGQTGSPRHTGKSMGALRKDHGEQTLYLCETSALTRPRCVQQAETPTRAGLS